MTRAERRRVAVDAALDEAVRTLEQTNLRAVLVMRDLCGQLSEAEGEADE